MIKHVRFGESQLFFCAVVAERTVTIASFSEFTLLSGQSEGRVLKTKCKRISFLLKKTHKKQPKSI